MRAAISVGSRCATAFRRRYFSVSPRSRSWSGSAGGELGHAVVEEREAALDRVAHQHPVALRVEQVALEERGDLQVLGLPERGHLAEPGGQARFQPLGRVAPLCRPAASTSSCEEREQPRRVGEAQPVAVERVVRVGEALAVEADEEGARALQVLADEGVQAGKEQRAQLRVGLAGPEVADRVLAEEVVAAEELVRALAGRDHLQPGVLHGPGEAQERRRRGAEGRLLGQLDRLREQLGDVACADRRPGEARARGRR